MRGLFLDNGVYDIANAEHAQYLAVFYDGQVPDTFAAEQLHTVLDVHISCNCE